MKIEETIVGMYYLIRKQVEEKEVLIKQFEEYFEDWCQQCFKEKGEKIADIVRDGYQRKLEQDEVVGKVREEKFRERLKRVDSDRLVGLEERKKRDQESVEKEKEEKVKEKYNQLFKSSE